ncbi:alpha/beta hydrolase [Listeria weihenstephanensis]|uniref:Alpha/beta hydrolase n=1 Tax=Listeria weihenstephanensis TaxID=1006155 RepID=A0A841Z3U0_9LIST|nr:alpha/beta hydrolase [Listeria weihenstephanensis]MBC1499117.1 alpha/beta hydrolase [Listeria weihenstephanensis]
MNYQEAKELLKTKAGNAEKWVKYVPGLEESGYLEEATKQELMPKDAPAEQDPNQVMTIEALRASMGWPSRDISVNALIIENDVADGNIPVRIYRKEALSKPVPVIVFFHGGGFFGGSLDNVEHPCRTLADKGDVVVVSVDYSLAPEKPYPDGLLDSYRAVKWVYRNADKLGILKEKIAVAGDSAGGNLSITVSLLDRTFGTNYIGAQVLLYPTVARGIDGKGELWDASRLGAKADAELIAGYVAGFGSLDFKVDEMYLENQENTKNPLVSPIYSERLGELPPTLVAVGEFDPLRLQNEVLVAQLRENGVATEYIQYNGMIHAFMDQIGDAPQAEDVMEETVRFVLGIFK